MPNSNHPKSSGLIFLAGNATPIGRTSPIQPLPLPVLGIRLPGHTTQLTVLTILKGKTITTKPIATTISNLSEARLFRLKEPKFTKIKDSPLRSIFNYRSLRKHAVSVFGKIDLSNFADIMKIVIELTGAPVTSRSKNNGRRHYPAERTSHPILLLV